MAWCVPYHAVRFQTMTQTSAQVLFETLPTPPRPNLRVDSSLTLPSFYDFGTYASVTVASSPGVMHALESEVPVNSHILSEPGSVQRMFIWRPFLHLQPSTHRVFSFPVRRTSCSTYCESFSPPGTGISVHAEFHSRSDPDECNAGLVVSSITVGLPSFSSTLAMIFI